MASKKRFRVVFLMLGVVALMAVTYLIAQQLVLTSKLTDDDIVLVDSNFESVSKKAGNILEPSWESDKDMSFRCQQGLYSDNEIIIVRFEFKGAADFICIAVLDDRYSSPLTKACDAFDSAGSGLYTGKYEGKTAAKLINIGITYYFLLDSGEVADALAVFGIDRV